MRFRSNANNSLTGLGPLESRIMETVWARGEATVGETAEALARAKPPAYTTIMTVMSRLHEKGLLTREMAGRAYVYRPAKTKEEFLDEAARNMVSGLVRDFGDLALSHFVEEIARADPARLRQLRSLLEREQQE